MASFTLGSDVYLEFKVKVSKRAALIVSASGELYHNDSFLRDFPAQYLGSKVTSLIDGKAFTTVGDYVAKFSVNLDGMGKHEHAIPFKITKSVLGRKRQ